MPITLPKQKVKATKLSPAIALIYGLPKVGKTEILTQLDDNLIIELERGTDRYDALAVQANSYDELNELIGTLATNYKAGGSVPLYKYGSVDTLDVLEEYAVHKAAEIYSKTPMGKTWWDKNYSAPGKLKPAGERIVNLPNGAGYGYVREAMKWYIDIFSMFFGNLILVSHVKDKRLKSMDGLEEVVVNDISLTGQLGRILAAYADAIGYLYRDPKGQLMVSFQTNENTVMGSRCKHLGGQKFPMDWSKIYID